MYEIDGYENLIDERHTEVFYTGGFEESEDPCDYVTIKEVVRNG